jgi:hypothetical protein
MLKPLRVGMVVSAFAVAALAFAPAALAQNPHFVTGPTTSVTAVGNTLNLNLAFKAAGLGSTLETAVWSVDGSGTLFSRCFNRGGNRPQADNKQETVPIDADFTTDVRNGQTTFSGTVDTVTSTLECPGNQVVRIVSFSGTGTLTGQGLTANLTWTFP